MLITKEVGMHITKEGVAHYQGGELLITKEGVGAHYQGGRVLLT